MNRPRDYHIMKWVRKRQISCDSPYKWKLKYDANKNILKIETDTTDLENTYIKWEKWGKD